MAAPEIVQSKIVRSTSAVASLDLSFDTTPGVGRLIVAFPHCRQSSGGLPALTFSDNQGNTYTTRESEGYAEANGYALTAPAVTSSGTFTLTYTPPSSLYCLIVAYEIANWNSSTVVEKGGKQWATGASGTYSPLNFTVTTAAEQLFLSTLISGSTGTARTYDPGTGWTLDEQITASGGMNGAAISKQVTSTGTYDPEFVMDAGGTQTVCLGISLVGGTEGPPSGGGGGIPKTTRFALMGVG